MSLRRNTNKRTKRVSSTSSSSEADVIRSETVSSEEETSGSESSRSLTQVSSSVSEELASSDSESDYSAENDHHYLKRGYGEIRYIVVDEKGRIISESSRRPPIMTYKQKKSRSSPSKHERKSGRKSERKDKSSKKSDRKHRSSSKKEKKRVKEAPKRAATPRKRKEKKVEQVISESDPTHIKLAKAIPSDIVTKLNLNKDTSIESITEAIMASDPKLFDKLTETSFVVKKANFTVGLPSDSHFHYGDLYICEMSNTGAVTRLERCVDMANDDSDKFRRLPHSFEKRSAMLELFNQRAPREVRDEVARPGHKDKVVSRINFLLNDTEGGAELSVPAESDPCSEICILKNDGSDDTPIKIVCIWQANIIREKKLICVKPKTDVLPAKSEIDKVVIARIALAKMLNDFIDTKEANAAKETNATKSESSKTVKRKRDERKSTKPEKKAKTEVPVVAVATAAVTTTTTATTTTITKEQATTSSSTSTSSSEEDEMSEETGPRAPVVTPKEGELPLWQSFIQEAKNDVPQKIESPKPQTSSIAQKLAERRIALKNEYKKEQEKK